MGTRSLRHRLPLFVGSIGVALAAADALPAAGLRLAVAAAAAEAAPASAAQAGQPPAALSAPHRATLDTYCVACHDGQLKTADLELDSADIANPATNAPIWEKVIRKLRTGAMPPAGMPRPDAATYNAVASYLESTLDGAAAAKLNPGRPAVHRLNRTEYANAIRDLLAVDASVIDIGALLPTDDSGYGFDNIGDVLTVSPALMEGYLSAARKIGRIAIGDREAAPVVNTYELPRFLIQSDRMSDDLPLGSRGGMAVRHHFPVDGEYTLRIKLQRNAKTYVVGTEFARPLDVRLDGQRIKQFTVGGDFQGQRPFEPQSFAQGPFEHYLMVADSHLEMRFPAKAGTHLVQVTFPSHTAEPEGVLQPQVTDYAYAFDYGIPDVEPAVATLVIGGPYNAAGIAETESRARIFVCRPAQATEEEPCARQILSTLARRAWRRPVSEADIADLVTLYRSGRADGSFEDGIEIALQRILVDPEFLFRIERDPPGTAPGSAYRLSDLELASRLSFFLWSSIPDDRLLDLAQRGQLGSAAVLEAEVRRMLADPRAQALVDNFAGQWLYLRNVDRVWPNPDFFPDFDINLREAFRQESKLFFASMLADDRSVGDLLTADYTFINERLARHYGIPNVYGSHFRRVSLPDPNRRGLLGQGSILTVTSYATRTAPTIRGKWLLENILGAPPPPPPPDVPSLDEKKNVDGSPLTVRQQMEMHRSNAVCASCHRVMDPLGFALENFDATGKWRTNDGGNAIDSSGVTPDGFNLAGPADLRAYLSARPEQFATTVTEKLLTYALGRGVEYYDQPAVRQILREAEGQNFRWSALLVAIAKSTPFQMRRSRDS